MKYLQLTQGKKAIINDGDYIKLSKYKWHYSHGHAIHRFYPDGRYGKKVNVDISHLIIGLKDKGFVVDHINRNSLDNRKENLRICTQSQNCKNQSLRNNNTSGFKGVSLDKITGRWRVQIWKDYKKFTGGRFKTLKEAALKYNELAKEYHKNFAKLNSI